MSFTIESLPHLDSGFTLFMNEVTHTKHYPLFVALAVTCMIIALVLIYRLVQIGSFVEPGGVFFFPLSYLISDVIAEVYGYKHARRQVWYIAICLILFSVGTTLAIQLPAPMSKLHSQAAYDEVFGNIWRVCLAFIIGILISDWLNVYLISKWKVMLKGRYFWMRSIGANAISEIIFSIICGSISYISIVNFDTYIKLVIDVWLFKMTYITILGYPMMYIVKLMRKVEKIDPSNAIKYNPFDNS